MADIVVFGGSNIDIKAKSIEAMRLGTSNPGHVSTTAGGVGRNIAHNLARLGASVALISVVGHDVHGDAVLATTSEAGVDVSGVARLIDGSTSSYLAFLDANGELVSAVSDMRIVERITPEVVEANAALVKLARLVVADCNLPLNTLLSLANLAREKLFIEPVSVPKSVKLLQVLEHGPIYLATPNFDQLEHLSKSRDIKTAFEFLHAKGMQNVVLHASAEGAFISDGKSIDMVQAQPDGNIIDVTGAGDAAVAGLLFGLLNGEDLSSSAILGQKLAGRVIASPRSTLE